MSIGEFPQGKLAIATATMTAPSPVDWKFPLILKVYS